MSHFRTLSVLDHAVELVAAQAQRSVALAIAAEARTMAERPQQIVRLLYPFSERVWPPADKTLVEMLVDCRAQMRMPAASMIALRAAEQALVEMIAAPFEAVERAAREVA